MTRVTSLAGTWSCTLDPGRSGSTRDWARSAHPEHEVTLPGTTQTNGVGPVYSVKQISNLTPGDYKVVWQKYCFFRKEKLSNIRLIEALESECTNKNSQEPNKVGFHK